MKRRSLLRLFLLFTLVLPSPALPAWAQKKPRTKAEREFQASVARFRARVEAELAKEKPQKGDWGVLVVDAATGETLYALGAQRYFTPASNTKMFTTALAMATLGPSYTYRTQVSTQGGLDAHGRLLGDVVLVARGDPNLSNRKLPYDKDAATEGAPDKVFAALADQVVAHGVRQIEGDIVVDDSYFAYDRYPAGWAIDDMTYGYGAPVSAICLNDNTLEIEVRPGTYEGSLAWFGVEPWAEYYEFENRITTGPAVATPPGGTENAGTRVVVEREPGSRHVLLRGTIAMGTEPLKLTLAIEEPAEYAAALLKRLLEARGVRIYGRARAQHDPRLDSTDRLLLAEHVSAPLAASLRVVNKISQNLHTEMLLRTVAREKTGAGSTREGLRLAQEFFKSIGIPEGDVAINDGSGLSRMNLITPRAAVALLRWAAQQPWADVYLASLPISGQDGTLARRMKDMPAAGRIQAKTGSLASTNALSGFATTLSGRRLVFSMFGNKHNLRGRESTEVLDAICLAMIEEIGAPPPKKRK